MCGIVGYIGPRKAGEVLFKGLKKLEYRGYDGAGIATVNGAVEVRKDKGKIEELNESLHFEEMKGSGGIAHTRWATHGGVTKANAHPHTDESGEIALVHNGIIENFQELKKGLAGKKFESDTDSEVIAHLIADGWEGSLEKAVQKAVKKLKGSYALLVISSREPGKIVCCRNESPLLVGIGGKKEFFAASDSLPLLEYTRRVAYLEDGESAVLTGESASFYRTDDWSPIEKEVHEADWNAEDAKAEGDYTLKEIMEQPQTLKALLANDGEAIRRFAEGIRDRPVIAVACGTARHAAVVGKHVLDRVAGKRIEVMIASEYPYFAHNTPEDAVLVAVSQSGETADTMECIREAKKRGLKVFSIVNVAGSSIDRASDESIHINCGPEIGVASTKAFLNQVAAFYLAAYALKGELEEGEKKVLEAAPLIQKTIDDNIEKCRELGEWVAGKEHAYYLGRGVNYAIAIEGALKLKEISYVHAEGMPAGELKHGTLALIEEGTPVVLLNPPDYTHDGALSNGIETKARGAVLVGVSSEENEAYDRFVRLPKPSDELFYPLLETVPLQLIAYYAAKARGNDADKPRNLAKSVTVK